MTKPIIPRKREITEKGNLIEEVAWRVPKSVLYPEGVKYAFTLIGNNQRVIAFDNYNNESHHIHIHNCKIPFKFKSLKKVRARFKALVKVYEDDKTKKY